MLFYFILAQFAFPAFYDKYYRDQATGSYRLTRATALEILGLTPASSPEEIKRAYRKKASLVHPDRNLGFDTKEQFQTLRDAYEELKGEVFHNEPAFPHEPAFPNRTPPNIHHDEFDVAFYKIVSELSLVFAYLQFLNKELKLSEKIGYRISSLINCTKTQFNLGKADEYNIYAGFFYI
jgi:hypothetical protein